MDCELPSYLLPTADCPLPTPPAQRRLLRGESGLARRIARKEAWHGMSSLQGKEKR